MQLVRPLLEQASATEETLSWLKHATQHAG